MAKGGWVSLDPQKPILLVLRSEILNFVVYIDNLYKKKKKIVLKSTISSTHCES